MNPIFALVDFNNFYASCEKLFRPDLKDAPVVVLSNNDGCVVLMGFYEYGTYQADLFRANEGKKRPKELMNVVDKINHSGLGSVFFSTQIVTPQWSMEREHLSPCYTTRWEDLKVVR